MSKYIESKEAINTELLLWDIRPTQTSIEETYDLIIYPTTIYNDSYGGPINFVIPPQLNGELYDIQICTDWCVKKGKADLANNEQVSIVNNFVCY